VEAGLASPAAALAIARDGLASVHARMRVAGADGAESALDGAVGAAPGAGLRSATVRGTAAPERELSVPLHRERLRGNALLRQVETWVRLGVAEPSVADAIGAVVANPDWLDLSDRTVVVLGAGAEMGPLQALLRWGATVAAVDLPRPALWRRVLETARQGAGTLLVPVRDGVSGDAAPEAAGADLLEEVPAIAAWLAAIDGPLVLGDYVYADGATNVRVCVAVDALRQELRRRRDDLALAFLATPTDVFVVPDDAVAQSARAYAGRSRLGRLAGRPLRTLSGGRLLRRNYVPGEGPGINDSLVPQQGPNYALAKRLQRWRAAEAKDAGGRVRGRAPLRRRGLRARHEQHADGRAARSRPADGKPGARASVARRGARRGPRRPLAHGLRPAQRARARRPPRPDRRADLTVPGRMTPGACPRPTRPAAPQHAWARRAARRPGGATAVPPTSAIARDPAPARSRRT
jgi:hypothetical protein